MKTIQDTLTEEVLHLIQEHNTLSKLNSFLCNNRDCEVIFEEMSNKDRMDLLMRMNKISNNILVPIIHETYNNKKVIINREGQQAISGVIKHSLTREYEGRVLHNEVAFRGERGNSTIALWVECKDKFDTHLYSITQLSLIV